MGICPLFSSPKEEGENTGDTGESESDGEEGGESNASKSVGKSAKASAAVRPKRLVRMRGPVTRIGASLPPRQSNEKWDGLLFQSGLSPCFA